MKTYLVTGAAGFIGANYIKHILAKHDDVKLVILDALTYAGNLGTIAKDIDDERCIFVKGDICDRVLADELFARRRLERQRCRARVHPHGRLPPEAVGADSGQCDGCRRTEQFRTDAVALRRRSGDAARRTGGIPLRRCLDPPHDRRAV